MVHHFKHYPDEGFIANAPWKIAQMKSIKAGPTARGDGSADSHCLCRPKLKLQHIWYAERSPKEIDEWSKVLEHVEKQARIRAVQMHLNTMTTLNALPLSIK